MPKFTFAANITHSGASVTVNADTEEEARQKAEAGRWDSEDLGGASMSDWEITSDGRLEE